MNNFWTSWPFLWVILWVFIWPVFLIFLRRLRRSTGVNRAALDILKERYAKGEINKQEFDEKKNDLASE